MGPEEIVEVAELVGVHGGSTAEEPRENVPVAKLDDGHRRASRSQPGSRSTAAGLVPPTSGRTARRHQPSSSVSAASTSVEMRERLREVPDEASGVHVVLLGQQAEVVAEPQQPLEQRLCLGQAALEDHHLDEPERARKERSFAGREPVDLGVLLVGAISHRRARRERALRSIASTVRRPARRRRGGSRRAGSAVRSRPAGRAVRLREGAELRVVTLAADLLVDLVADGPPAARPGPRARTPRRFARHGRRRPTPSPWSA